MSRIKNLTNNVYGRLTVVKYHGKVSSNKTAWECLCECGNVCIVRSGHLVSKHTSSCGCLPNQTTQRLLSVTTHGHTKGAHASPTYNSWKGMRTRCNNPNNKDFSNYGGRGIAVCAEWGSFITFLRDMGEKPVGTSLERKDNHGDYSPGNCKWATATEQARNTRVNKLSIENIELIQQDPRVQLEIATEYGVSQSLVSRIKSGEVWR